jgi:predicted DNA-binding WGR domain protein
MSTRQCAGIPCNRNHFQLNADSAVIESGMVKLTNIDPSKNMRRFYSVQIGRTLFGEWSLMREWGRIGSPGRVTLESFASEEEAWRAEHISLKLRARHGYK